MLGRVDGVSYTVTGSPAVHYDWDAVLLDATIVRGILVPAAMALLGERCWYLPRRLGWLPGGLLESPDAMAA